MTEEKRFAPGSAQGISRRNNLIQRGLEAAQRLSSIQALLRVQDILPPPFEWALIPGGRVTLKPRGVHLDEETTFNVGPFLIAVSASAPA